MANRNSTITVNSQIEALKAQELIADYGYSEDQAPVAGKPLNQTGGA